MLHVGDYEPPEQTEESKARFLEQVKDTKRKFGIVRRNNEELLSTLRLARTNIPYEMVATYWDEETKELFGYSCHVRSDISQEQVRVEVRNVAVLDKEDIKSIIKYLNTALEVFERENDLPLKEVN